MCRRPRTPAPTTGKTSLSPVTTSLLPTTTNGRRAYSGNCRVAWWRKQPTSPTTSMVCGSGRTLIRSLSENWERRRPRRAFVPIQITIDIEVMRIGTKALRGRRRSQFSDRDLISVRPEPQTIDVVGDVGCFRHHATRQLPLYARRPLVVVGNRDVVTGESDVLPVVGAGVLGRLHIV